MAPPAGQIRPARYLAGFALIVVALYALVFLTGDHQLKPKLGIDLQGGTRVTLTARTPDGKDPSKEALDQARQIIEQRVNGLGVSGAEVVVDGSNVVITVPGEQGDQAKSVGQTAKLGFRAVLGQPVPAQAQPTPNTQSSTPPSGTPSSGSQPSGSSTTPSAGSQPSSGAPQGRPAPALEQAGSSTPPAPSSGASTPPTSGSVAPSSPAPSSNGVDPKVAEEIAQAKALRQSTDPQIQQQALALLSCQVDPKHPDPLAGNDDPNLPLVTCDKDGQFKYVLDKVFLDGDQVSSASEAADPKGAGFVVNLNFNGNGTKVWGDFTSANVGKQVAVVLDTRVMSAPRINEAILGGNTQISGKFSMKEAQDLAGVLNFGKLPLSFTSSEAETVSASLGAASLKAGLIAGGIGLALVFVYCLIYYRALGVLTILSLGLSGVIVFGVLVLLGRWVGLSLDLSGIAGFIVAIGITADSFVVFFERMKDEVREGRTFRSAVPRAWVRARRTILSADAVSFLAAAVLYVLAVGQVQGFAFTLGMSTVLDLIVVFLVTHPLVALASKSKFWSNPKFSGLGAVQRSGAAQRAAAASSRPAVAKEA
ncbi:protein translocase subunit SecD [Solihabitans fulvus]|uniref:Protein translocase subunit SecD n=1 Tax=Solihabitans fulvus TaxID=1892852 RepID=A0A5B2XF82_9PSEU|nr:protein translocase subunit SecD [Solihabitans fulvus]KAA2261916.1 protein translocase subunit SecD [Solihabitans fulvus]